MKRASVRELRERIGELLDEVQGGAQVVVTRRGKAVARIIPEGATTEGASRHPLRGSLRRMSADFDLPDDELWEASKRSGS